MSLSVDDRVEMLQLVARYNHAADARDAEKWAQTFTQEGVFVKNDEPEVRGRAALQDKIRNLPHDNTRHWTLNVVIDEDADGDGSSARMTADFALLHDNEVLYTGRYLNLLAKVEGRWRFARRALRTNPSALS
jgi:ketosteroid isomerase-like protein